MTSVLRLHPRVGALGADRCLPGALRLQGFTHARFQALQRKGFEQIVAGAGLHGLDGILDAAVGGHDDDRNGYPQASHRPQHVQPAHIGHFEVGDHQAEACAGQPGQGLAPARGGLRGKPAALERLGERGPDGGVVVDNQYGLGSGGQCTHHFQRRPRPAAAAGLNRCIGPESIEQIACHLALRGRRRRGREPARRAASRRAPIRPKSPSMVADAAVTPLTPIFCNYSEDSLRYAAGLANR